MNNHQAIANKLKIMGHPIRLQILDVLRQGETCVCHIEHALKKRQAYISQQLMTLRDANVVTSRKEGLQVYYQLVDDQVRDLLNLLSDSPMGETMPALEGCKCPRCSTMLDTQLNNEEKDTMLQVKVLGSGCANCQRLERETRAALDAATIAYEISKVTDYAEIASYGVMRTPALVINETVVASGKIPKHEQIVRWAQENQPA